VGRTGGRRCDAADTRVDVVDIYPSSYGDFVSALIDSGETGPSFFENIAERSEEEILELFVGTAEAADSCSKNRCDSDGTAKIDVVAIIGANPTTNTCVQARVSISGASCLSTCLIFDLMNVVVNDQSV